LHFCWTPFHAIHILINESSKSEFILFGQSPKNSMKPKSKVRHLALGLMLAVAPAANAAVTVTVDPAKTWNGFMNVFELPVNGGGFVFPSGWAPVDLRATFSGPILTLSPNTIGDPDPFWYIGGGGPGQPGNKIMQANMYVQEDGPLAGQTVNFTGIVTSYTFTEAHTTMAFIRDFAPDFSSFVESAIVLDETGAFSISLNTIDDAARHVQYGFQTTGVNVWVTDVAPFGDIQITAIPEPSGSALPGLADGLLFLRRRRG
jgi:hypothetical protein